MQGVDSLVFQQVSGIIPSNSTRKSTSLMAESGSADPSYLTRRAGVYYVQMAVPREAQAALGRKTLERSLRTRDRGQALALRFDVVSEFRKAIREATGKRLGDVALAPASPGSTPKSRTVVKGLRTSGLAWRPFAAALGCGTAQCIRTHRHARHRASGSSCGRSARA